MFHQNDHIQLFLFFSRYTGSTFANLPSNPGFVNFATILWVGAQQFIDAEILVYCEIETDKKSCFIWSRKEKTSLYERVCLFCLNFFGGYKLDSGSKLTAWNGITLLSQALVRQAVLWFWLGKHSEWKVLNIQW